MPINFPNSPSPNQQYTYDNKTWGWNGIYWEVYSALTSYVTYTTFNSYTATTQPLIYRSITGGTYSGGTLYLTNNSGTTIQITGFTAEGLTGNYLPLSGGTVTGATNFTSGLTANTISATTYQNLPATPFLRLTGGTVNGFVRVQPTQSTTEKALFSISENSSESIALYGLAGKGTNAYGVYCDVAPSEEFYTITNGIGGYFEVGGQFSEGEPTNKYSLQLKDGTEGVGKILTSVTSDGKANWDTPKTNGSNLYLFYNY